MNDTYCARVENETILRGFSKAGEIAFCCKSQNPFPMDAGVEKLNEVKTALDNGIKHKHCSFCWKQESLGIKSWRQIGNELEFKYKNIELYLDNTCDQACIYCSPKYSTSWAQEIKQNPFTQDFVNAEAYDVGKEKYDHLPSILSYIEEIGKSTPETRPAFINILGGEPLLTSAIKKNVISDIIEAYYKHIDNDTILGISIVTNGNTPDHIIDKTIEILKQKMLKYKNLRLGVSISLESLGLSAEFVRYRLEWTQLKKNLHKWFALKNCTVGFSMAVNMITWKQTPEFFRWTFAKAHEYNQKINFAFNTVMFPRHLSLQMLPKDQFYIFNEMEKVIRHHRHLIVNTERYENLLIQIEQAKDNFGRISHVVEHKEKALQYFTYIKKYRNQDITDVNPELLQYLRDL